MRIFLAYPLPNEVKDAIRKVISDLQTAFPNLPVLWIREENMHVTTEFLGEINTSELEVFKSTIQQEVSKLPTFEFSLGKLDVFPNFSHPGVLVLQVVEKNGDTSVNFRNSLHQKLLDKKIAKDNKPWRPHITLGRLKKPSKLNVDYFEHYKPDTISWSVENLDLFDSTLTPEGAIYKVLNTYTLK